MLWWLAGDQWQGDQWAMVFEDGFRVNFVIVFVIVLCHVNSPHLWDTLKLGLLKKDGGASAAAFELPEVTLRGTLR